MTQTLERFWRWHDTEKPSRELARKMLDKNVSAEARAAVDMAASLIDCHAVQHGFVGHRLYTNEALERYPEALRDLSLVLCRGLAVMRGQVPILLYGVLATQNRLLADIDQAELRRVDRAGRAALMANVFETGHLGFGSERVRCVRESHEFGDDRPCAECFSTPCRWSNRGPLAVERDAGFNRCIIGPEGVESRRQADNLRGMRCDWHVRGTVRDWMDHGGENGLTLLRYLVEQVLAPGGGTITAEHDDLAKSVWWPRPTTPTKPKAKPRAAASRASCRMHGEFYAGCLTCQQARYREQQEMNRVRDLTVATAVATLAE